MPRCQLCGEDADSTTKTKIEGAVLKVCESCAEMGEKVSGKQKKTRSKKTRSSPRSQQVLTDNYGKKVKQAREDRKLSIQELSDDLNEKTSVLKKIEQEKLKPDKSLAAKLSRELEVELYVNPQVSDYDDTSSGDTREATLGDVADVKKSE